MTTTPGFPGATAAGTDSTPGNDTEALAEIRAYQSAARRLVRNPDLTTTQTCVALVRLVLDARQRAEAPELCQEAIWAESGTFIKTGARPMDRETIVEALAAHDPVQAALRALLRTGQHRCPRCLRAVPTEEALDRQRDLARQGLEVALIREDAV
jgi:tagatose-1,6-bisphosphate aldolase non-catalytic subunit AgaZ/GatZ